jgi:hypothetical protein
MLTERRSVMGIVSTDQLGDRGSGGNNSVSRRPTIPTPMKPPIASRWLRYVRQAHLMSSTVHRVSIDRSAGGVVASAML